MSGIIDMGGAIISRASQRMEVTAQNLSNLATYGYRAQRTFSDLITEDGVEFLSRTSSAKPTASLEPGKLVRTGNPFDLALAGTGFFVLRSGDSVFYTRDGQFTRDKDGRLVSGSGLALQSDSGDVAVGAGTVKVTPDGVVLEDGQPVAKLSIVTADDPTSLEQLGGSLFKGDAAAMKTVDSPQVHQGMLESSNVSAADEMIALMGALRSAESGQKIVQAWDDLMGQALTAFGQANGG